MTIVNMLRLRQIDQTTPHPPKFYLECRVQRWRLDCDLPNYRSLAIMHYLIPFSYYAALGADFKRTREEFLELCRKGECSR